MLKKLIVVISIMWEHLKSLLIALLIGGAIIFALSSIIHNVLKIREAYAEDSEDYKNLAWVNENRMNVKVAGDGNATVVILPDFAESSPALKYKTYENRLAGSYRVATIEYFGYGYSLSTKEDRTCMQIAQEIKSALTSLNVPGPYIFVANGVSSLYAYSYCNLYPDDIQRMVIIDGVYPDSLNDVYTKKYVEDLTTNASITSFFELTGYARILSYINPSTFHIDTMKKMEDYSADDIKLYRKMIANRYYTGTMRKEVKELKNNMETLSAYKYPDYLPVTQIISTGYEEEVNNLISEKKTKVKLEEYTNNIKTNNSIQNVITIEGGKSNLSLDNPDEVVQVIMN